MMTLIFLRFSSVRGFERTIKEGKLDDRVNFVVGRLHEERGEWIATTELGNIVLKTFLARSQNNSFSFLYFHTWSSSSSSRQLFTTGMIWESTIKTRNCVSTLTQSLLLWKSWLDKWRRILNCVRERSEKVGARPQREFSYSSGCDLAMTSF